jgi:mono/diheme cytochrome c family protein
MKRRVWVLATMAGSAALTACGHHFEPPDRAKQVAEAAAQYTPAVFDSVTWPTDSVRELDGNAVYAASCRKCHGTMGEGGTDYDRVRNLTPPSLVRPNWGYDSLDSLRKRIWVGHAGMPTFGIAGITARDIDGVAYYLLKGLRPDVLGRSGGR